MEIRTHQVIDRELCGEPLEVGEGYSRVSLTTLPVMGVDERGLVHGGFVFGLADYAAMLAVNHSHVVLGRTEARFLKPVLVGEELVAEAEIFERRDNKRLVQVGVFRDSERIFDGEFVCYVLDRHVLDKGSKQGGSGERG